ncbi:ogr/Delta-like zinc finger family protein [Providencia rettgeri]
MAMKCPICEEIAHTRSSEYLSSQTKRSYMQCKNINCSCTFAVLESIDYIISQPIQEKEIKTETSIQNVKPKNLDRCLNKYGDNFQHKDRHAQ